MWRIEHAAVVSANLLDQDARATCPPTPVEGRACLVRAGSKQDGWYADWHRQRPSMPLPLRLQTLNRADAPMERKCNASRQ
jgi:hypothetical protein